MDDPTMSYTRHCQAHQAFQEPMHALEGAVTGPHSAPVRRPEAAHAAGTGAATSAPEAYLVGGAEMGQRIRAHDWSATPLGPVDAWPQSLRSAVSILLPSKAQIVLFWGPELIAIYNDAYAPTFGAKHPWALGRPARECWSEVWYVIGPLFEGVVRTGEAFWAKEHPFFLHRQGFLEETYYDVSYDPVRIEDGSVGGVFCIVNDQTGRVLGERRLRTLRELGTRTADAKSAAEVCRAAATALELEPADIPFALIYLIDTAGGRAVLVGSSGVGRADLTCQREVVLADLDALATACEGQAAEVETTVFVSRVPETAAEHVLVLPITSGTQIVGVLVAGVSRFLHLAGDYRDFFDLAAARLSAAIANAHAYEEERRRAEALAELDRAKTAFFSNVSHEFRTPLTLLLSPLEDLLATPESRLRPEHQELLTVVHRNGLRLQKLVNTLLDFARIEAGRVQAVYEPTDLALLTADLASTFRSACERAGLRLVVDCPALPECVYIDRDMWEKVVLNLLSNAFKFTFTGEIAVTLGSAGDAVELTVRDTGIGIPAAEVPYLFERFHRVDGARGRTHEGTGIGLALVQELVQLHSGSVRVESIPGQGSTFFVSIPTGTAHLPADRIGGTRTLTSTALGASPYVEEALRWLPEAGALTHTPPDSGSGLGDLGPPPVAALNGLRAETSTGGQRARIVWADDNADMRDYVCRLLSAWYDVEAVANGEAALAAARTRRPDLVLVDVMMPHLDGFGVLRALRADPAMRTLSVILLSARAGEEARVEGLEAGADAYITKPFSARELLAQVEAQLQLGRMRAHIAEERAALVALFQQTPMPIAVVRGPELVYDLVNPAYREVVGGRDILGKPLLEALPELHGQRFDHLLHGVMQTGMPYVGYEVPAQLDRQGTGAVEDTYWTFIYAPMRDESDRVDRVIIIANEVTEAVQARHQLERLAAAATTELHERQRVEQALRDSEQRFRDMIDALPAAIYTTDSDGRLTHFNPAAVTFSGHVPELGTDQWYVSWKLYYPDGTPMPHEACPMDIALKEGRAVHGAEAIAERPDGTRLWFEPYPTPLRDSDGRIVGSINMLVDITERKQTEAAVHAREAQLQTLFDAAPLGVYLVDADFRIRQVNPTALPMFGDIPDLIGRDFDEVIHLLWSPPYGDEIVQLFRHTLTTGEPYMTPERIEERRDLGVTEYYEWQIHRIPLPDGRYGVVCHFRDISAQVFARQAIAESEARYRTLAAGLEQRVQERTALMALIQDVTRAANETPSSAAALQYAVDRYCAYAGWPIGHVCLAVAPGATRWASTDIWHLDAPECFTVFQQTTRALEFTAGEGLVGRVGARGQPEWLRDVATDPTFRRQHAAQQAGLSTGVAWPLLVGNEVAGVLEFYTPESLAPNPALLEAMTQIGMQLGRAIERERAAAEAQRQQEALFQREKLAAMSTMLASVAHELNNPLAIILMQADILREESGSGPLAETAAELTHAATRCERLVRTFLTLARQHAPERTSVDLNALLSDTMELLAPVLRVDAIAVELRLAGDLPHLRADVHQLQQVLVNLLTNAQQALRDVAAPRQVTLTTQWDPERAVVTLEVADTGPGIPLAIQARIFEPFFTTKPAGVGTGLGLPLCRGVIEGHGGTFSLSSVPGAGTTFRVELPVGVSTDLPPDLTGQDEATPAVSGGAILLVDDETGITKALPRLLQRDGHTVDTAANGLLALAQLQERTYDVILCDLRMPELDGPGLYRALEQRAPHLCRRFIFLTGDTLSPELQHFLTQRGVPQLTKPFNATEVRQAVAQVLRAV